jgi:hypothetical protein
MVVHIFEGKWEGYFANSIPASDKKKRLITVTKITRVMFGKIILASVYSGNQMKHINTLYRTNDELLNIKAGNADGYHKRGSVKS